jgi:hypothetical protein
MKRIAFFTAIALVSAGFSPAYSTDEGGEGSEGYAVLSASNVQSSGLAKATPDHLTTYDALAQSVEEVDRIRRSQPLPEGDPHMVASPNEDIRDDSM